MSAHEPEYLKHLTAEEIATVAHGSITAKNKQIESLQQRIREIESLQQRIRELEPDALLLRRIREARKGAPIGWRCACEFGEDNEPVIVCNEHREWQDRIRELEAERDIFQRTLDKRDADLAEAIRVLSVVYEVYNDGGHLSGDEEDDVYKLLTGG